MKIDVTYEKADIIRLVREDLERKGLHLKPGTQPEYKGALAVKMSVEAVEDAPPVPPPQGEQPLPPDLRTPPAEADEDMATVLSASRQVAATTSPTFKVAENDGKVRRPLGPNESVDFPRE